MSTSESSRQSTDQYDNPYFLRSSDHAGLVLVSDRLSTRADFHAWRRSVRMALNVRNKLGFIDGTITKPSSEYRDGCNLVNEFSIEKDRPEFTVYLYC